MYRALYYGKIETQTYYIYIYIYIYILPGSLNKKSELISTCRHVNKHLIKNA